MNDSTLTSVAQIIQRRRNRRQRQQQRQSARRWVSWGIGIALFVLVGVPLGAGAGIVLQYYVGATANLPTPQATLVQTTGSGPSQLFDRSGQTLLWAVESPSVGRDWLALDDLPPYLVQAALLREDPDFLDTAGFYPAATAGRLLNYALQNTTRPLAPDPTLTGRLVRNAIAPPPDIISNAYRLREYALVLELNRRYSPEAILEWHLNTNHYGGDIYGIETAARVYFDKPAVDLTLDEAAMLAAIPTAPQYNPFDDLVAARGRQAEVLRDLALNEVISQDAYTTANATVTTVASNTRSQPEIAPEFTRYAREQAESILDQKGYDGGRLLSRGGLRITTTLDLNLYEQVACTVDSHLSQLNGLPGISPEQCPGAAYLPDVLPVSGPVPDVGAAVLLDVRSGELLAAVGDVSARVRQPGPLLRPFVYFRSFSSQSLNTAATMVYDAPLRFSGAADGLIYTPSNPDGSFSGPVNLRDAMSAGLLPPAVAVASNEGLENILRTAQQVGLIGLTGGRYDLSLLERGGGVSVLDATYAYTVFAAEGQMHGVPSVTGARTRDPVAVLRIEDADGNLLWAYEGAERELAVTPIMDTGLSYLVNHILSDPAPRAQQVGVGSVFELSRPAAVVFGAAGSGADLWTVGYSPNLAVGVWMGRADEGPTALGTRATVGAAPVWNALMEFTHDIYGLGPDNWPRPLNVVEARVCERSGLLATEVCPDYVEIFLEGTIPPDTDNYWQEVTVNSQNGRLATANTPTALREDRVFFVPPPEVADWWEEQQLPLPPEEFDTVTRPELVQSTVILRPELLDYVSGVVDVRGSLDGENLQYYQVAYGQGLNPSEWVDLTGQRTDYVPGQSLAEWDTEGLDGLYNLRLTAVLNDNSIDPFIIQVTVDNTPPSVSLTTENRPFTFLNDEVIPLTAEAQDNVAIDRVEFYANGEFVGTDDSFPFGYEHPITRVGDEVFTAVVFDQAGNQASSEITVTVARGGT